MSLRVWLPLNGDLRNNGLSNITVTNNGATVDNNGKIGKCYSFDGTNDKITLTNLPNPSNISIAFWMKRSANTGTRQFMFTAWNGVTCELTSSGVIHCYVAPSHGACDSTNAITVDNGWVHVVYTFEDKICGKLYINGSLVKTTASSNSISWNTTTGNLGYFSTYFNGKLNDFRVYDHCLSAKEVKEISKGLVCHYKLDSSNKGCDNILTNSTGYNGITNWSGVIEASNENGHPFLIAKRTDTTSTSRTFVTHSAITSLVNNWAIGTEFTISGYYKVPSNEDYNVTANLFIRWTHKSGESAYTDTGFSTPSNVEKDKWIRFENTYSVPSNYVDGAVNFYLSAFNKGLSTIYWKDIKLEKGNKATIWSPSSNDAEYIKLGYNNTTIYDCSGYNYHGTNHNIEINSESPRYNLSTYLKGTNSSYINTLYSTNIGTSDFTISLWIKIPTISSGSYYAVCTSKTTAGKSSGFGIYWNYTQKKFLWSTADGTTATEIFMATAVDSIVYDNWIHLVMVRNSSDAKKGYFYINGIRYELASVPAIRDITTDTKLFLGTCTNIYYYLKAYYSDFRIYMTALSADDILELYQTSASIDKSGNMFAYEFKED